MAKAIKGEEFKGYFDVTVAKKKTLRFDNGNAAKFHPIAHQVLARGILDRVAGSISLVPIPNSHVTACDAESFRTRTLAEGVSHYGQGRITAFPNLVFDKPQAKSHGDGGSRDPDHFEQAYQLTSAIHGKIVLLDDVLTSAAHVIGAYRMLSALGHEVVMAAAWGRTTSEQLEPVFRFREETLNVDRFTIDFDDVTDFE